MQPFIIFGRKDREGDGEIPICAMKLVEQTTDTV